ncbi:MAG: alpha-L-arabinofuranosidase C-terminal domain-containing protein [Candidatus Omnitrophota bacterium]|nr:alpha-L-arabinofuranosidase C-terminal domain-containing protein [Candidatus Omnitrophota bacterium]
MRNHRIFKIIFTTTVFLFSFDAFLYAQDHNIIIVETKNKSFNINKKIYGNNSVAYDPMTYENWAKEYYGYSDYGAGIWNPKWRESVKEVIDLVKDAGITIVRFPGGCGTHHYNWKNAIGKERIHFLYGIDEFLKTCEEVRAESVITVSYFTGNEQDAADLIEYLNSPNDGRNPNGGIDWAVKRVKNGHFLPYNVKYFEIGNEVYHGDHQKIKKVEPEDYARRYLKYYQAMKAVDLSIKIGTVFHTKEWDEGVLKIIREKVDFGIIHTYPTPVWGKGLEQMDTKEIFRISLAIPIYKDEVNFQNTLKLLREKSGRNVPLAITEYNGGFVQSKPVPYRHCLGTALLNAELLRIFMKPEHNILMANYWQFCNGYFGMIKSKTDFIKHDYRYPINYIKRPNYYVFELYHKHFGSNLISTDVKCDSYRVKGHSIPYLSVNASTDAAKNRIYLMVINRNLDESVTAIIDLKDFVPSGKGEAWILNGPSVDATNEENPNNVKVRHIKFKVRSSDPTTSNLQLLTSFQFTFEPHSLTAIEVDRRQ